MTVLAAFSLSTSLLLASSPPRADERPRESTDLGAELASGDARRVAFAAIAIAERHDGLFASELVAALRTADQRVAAAHAELVPIGEFEEFARADLLHALVQVDAKLSAEELDEFVERGLTNELVILACRSRPESDPFLERLTTKDSPGEWWLAAFNALHGDADDEWIEAALPLAPIHVVVRVDGGRGFC